MYPKAVWKFIPWSKAMVAGATVGSPEYKSKSTGSTASRTRRKGRKKRKKRNNAKKD